MRILYVIDSLGASGAEHSTSALLPLLQARGHQIQVATLYDAGFGDEERIRADGFDVRPLAESGWFGRVRELRGRIREFRPDVVHTSLFTCDVIGRLASWRSGAGVVSSLVSTPYAAARLADPDVRAWKVRVLQGVDAVTARLFVDRLHAVSPGVADVNARALRFPRSRITVVERGRSRESLGLPSPERRRVMRTTLGVTDSQPVVVAVGRQEHAKAHTDLVTAVDALVTQLPDLRVFIAGRDGNATELLKACLEEHPAAAARMTLLGHRHDVPDLLCAADVLAIPSVFEGTAGVALEAMALDCPVVCSDLDGLRGILVDGETALMAPPGSGLQLAAAIHRVLTEPRLATSLREHGRADFEDRFTIERAAERMESLYADVAHGGSARVSA